MKTSIPLHVQREERKKVDDSLLAILQDSVKQQREMLMGGHRSRGTPGRMTPGPHRSQNYDQYKEDYP